MNMCVHHGGGRPRGHDARTLLDLAAEVLAADPAASLAEVAQAAGIGRTTLHKPYATRDDLLRAVEHRALDLWAQVIGQVGDGLRALTEAMIPIGPQLAFLWRTPIFDRASDIGERWPAVEALGLAVRSGYVANDSKKSSTTKVLSGDTPFAWLIQKSRLPA
jgi:AcrR family transcriptional regulator